MVVGLVSGVINTIAGGGSFLSLPVLIFLGMPPVVANGTNRVAILLQCIAATVGFRRHGALDLRALTWAAVPATLGAVLGTLAALWISDGAFQRVLAVLMVVVTLWTLWSGDRAGGGEEPGSEAAPRRALHVGWLAAGFFVVGVYGGFVQAGVGFLVLAVTTLAGLDLVRGNAVKMLAVLCFTVVSLALFAWGGKILWAPGLVHGIGSVAGALIGVRLTVLKGHAWLQRVVTVTIVVFAVKLFWDAL
ncbi:MAG: sulfite exporter TauE/SafE family protein [Acidobacteria bacterium]|nr:MAG: sulfite exporter TauE/SafE family protein [Acidobacteriota bacterium]REK00923.1 MAG: sulfite exporter TauE/SafE family protein [Acidobacteriota bacterium]